MCGASFRENRQGGNDGTRAVVLVMVVDVPAVPQYDAQRRSMSEMSIWSLQGNLFQPPLRMRIQSNAN
jgi:hypothetical protein